MSKNLGKHERQAAKRKAIVTANLSQPLPLKASNVAPAVMAWKGHTRESRDSLHRSTHHVGFVGPRGFKTPSDTSPKHVESPGSMAPVQQRPNAKQSTRFAMDDYNDGPRNPSTDVSYRKRKSQRQWRRIGG